jgi:DNA-directed RNA polymerase specialized sigma24 family protein
MKLAAPARMELRAATRRSRAATIVPTPGASPVARGRIAGALRACTVREQLVLVLLLYEQLTPSEAAATLGLTPRQVERAYFTALADLQCALRGARNGRRSRAIARRSLVVAARLRRAS